MSPPSTATSEPATLLRLLLARWRSRASLHSIWDSTTILDERLLEQVHVDVELQSRRPASARAQATRDGSLRAQQPSRPCLDARAHMTADFQLGRILVASLLYRLIGHVTLRPSLEFLASRDVSLSMLQDYTVYTHLAEPSETLLPPARRVLAALPGPAGVPNGHQRRCGGRSMWPLQEAFWNPCHVATPAARGPVYG